MYIDSHVHFWALERGDYGWLKPDNPVLYRNYSPTDLKAMLAAEGVQGVIAVQAAGTVEETRYLLELSDLHDFIIGVVGWLDLLSDTFESTYRELRKHARFVGIRLNGSVFSHSNEEEKAQFIRRLQMMEDDQFSVDLLVQSVDLANVTASLQHVPQLKAVINHVGSPPYLTGDDELWREQMQRVAENPHMYVKWSGIVTQTKGFKPELAMPYTTMLTEWFGSERMMFGSDWPVSLQAGTYADVVRLFEALVPQTWSLSQKEAVRMNNARAFYLG